MPETSAREAEIAIEQQLVDRVYARLAEVRAETKALRDRGHELAHGAGREAIYEQAQMLIERDVMVQHANKMLQSLDAEHEGLVFGRLDLGNAKGRGETLYIGRLGLRDANFDNLVLDWRAPASAAFYQATAEEPMDVLRRRVIRCSQEKVLDIDDDVLTPDALTEDITVIGEGALMAALGRARGDTMRDIVATIQREQDEAIRAPQAGVTQITGGPGTGKTAVALHRAAYLLYRNRRQMTGAGVLVIGPSPVFTNYISRVLPSMGEDSVDLRALGEMLDGEQASYTDSAPVAVIKGSPRMLRLLRKATRQMRRACRPRCASSTRARCSSSSAPNWSRCARRCCAAVAWSTGPGWTLPRHCWKRCGARQKPTRPTTRQRSAGVARSSRPRTTNSSPNSANAWSSTGSWWSGGRN